MSGLPDIFTEDRRGYIAAVGLAGVGEAIAIGFAAFAMRDAFAALHGGTHLPTAALTILIASGVIVAALRVTSRTLAEHLGQSYAIDLRRNLYRHLAGMSRSTIAERRVGALSLRFVGDLTAARGWASLGLTRVLSAALVLPGAALTLWLLNPTLATAAAVPLCLTLIAMLFAAVLVEPLHKRLRSKRANVAISMMERVSIAPELDLMRRTRREVKALDENGERLSAMAVARTKAVTGLRAIPEIGSALAGAAILWAASRNNASAADAAAALAVLAILSTPLRELAGVWDRRCAWKIAHEKCETLFAKPSTRRRPSKKNGGVGIRCAGLRVCNVSCDVSIAKGEAVVLTGPIGSGKSTFLYLAAGLEMPEEGRVTYDDDVELPRVIHISPNAPILQGSLRRALTLGSLRRPTDAVIETAARRFGFGPVLDRLGDLSARVGEGGRTLSSCEMLQLHMIRAYLSEPNLIIIDTPGITTDPTLNGILKALIEERDATVLIASSEATPYPYADCWLHIADDRLEQRTMGRVFESQTIAA